jgi:hypothetical protein
VSEDTATAEVSPIDGSDQSIRRELAQIRNALGAARGSEKIRLLEEAIVKQRDLTADGRASQADLRRLRELETDLATARAAETNVLIAQLIAAADTAETATALVNWQEALRLQRQVNRSPATAAAKNFVREERIEQQLQERETQPLAAEVAAAMTTAREALAAQRWEDALAALTSARQNQLRINNEFSRSRFASLRTLDEIDREIATLDAATFAIEVDALEAAGDAALATEDFEAAVNAFEEARQAQLRINREFSRSRFLSSPRVEQLEVKRQTASSLPRLAGIRIEMAAIDRLLARREVGLAVEKIELAADRLEDVFAQLPKSEALDESLRLKLSYLAGQTARIGEIQDAVYDELRPLPGVAERRLLRTELPQALYLQVMRTNPSRQAGRAFPVDSVNWHEATAFCQRLAWILARPVRLPTADEFRVAVGDPARQGVVADDIEETQPMAAAAANEWGFHDLLGNVAEWLADSDADQPAMAAVAGGSFRDREATLRTVPVRPLERADRARHVGFRILVEFEEP